MGYMTFVKRMVANLFKPPVTSPYPLQPRTPLPVDRGHIVNQWKSVFSAAPVNGHVLRERYGLTERTGSGLSIPMPACSAVPVWNSAL